MKSKSILMMVFTLVFLVVLSACGAADNNQDGAPPSGESDELPPVAVVRARETLAAELGIGIADVEILAYEQAEWSDSCLGLGGIAESCLQVIVEGWQVELSAQGRSYIARTDELGESIRFE